MPIPDKIPDDSADQFVIDIGTYVPPVNRYRVYCFRLVTTWAIDNSHDFHIFLEMFHNGQKLIDMVKLNVRLKLLV